MFCLTSIIPLSFSVIFPGVRRGDCGSCTLTVGGTRVKPCIGKVPDEPRLKSLQEKGLAIK